MKNTTLTYNIENAHTLEEKIHEEMKLKKFNELMSRQIDAITRTMQEFENGCNFFFADITQYRRDYERVWFNEFYQAAKKQFMKSGYSFEYRSNYEYIIW